LPNAFASVSAANFSGLYKHKEIILIDYMLKSQNESFLFISLGDQVDLKFQKVDLVAAG
jgi:hypothetical protein